MHLGTIHVYMNVKFKDEDRQHSVWPKIQVIFPWGHFCALTYKSNVLAVMFSRINGTNIICTLPSPRPNYARRSSIYDRINSSKEPQGGLCTHAETISEDKARETRAEGIYCSWRFCWTSCWHSKAGRKSQEDIQGQSCTSMYNQLVSKQPSPPPPHN